MTSTLTTPTSETVVHLHAFRPSATYTQPENTSGWTFTTIVPNCFQKFSTSARICSRRFWGFIRHCIEIKWPTTIRVQKELYSIVQLNKRDFASLLPALNVSNKSEWYSNVNSIPIFFGGLRIKPVNGRVIMENGWVAVIPCQISRSGETVGLLAVCEELRPILQVIRRLSDDFKSGFHSPHLEPIPVVFAFVRYSRLSERKMRRTDMPEFLRKVRNAVQCQIPNQNINTSCSCVLVMLRDVFEQSGLYLVAESIRDIGPGEFVKAKVKCSKLNEYVESIQGIDKLVCDLLIISNDLVLSKKRFGEKLNLLRVRNANITVSKTSAIDQDQLKFAIRHAYSPPVEEDINLIDWSESEMASIENAVKYTSSFCQNGVTSDQPRKITYGYEEHLHLLTEGKAVFKPFRRRVETVSSLGYRARIWSMWMWFVIYVGALVPIIYIVIRSSELKFEDLIRTSSSLLAVYIAIFPPLFLNLFYKGESIGDILSNIRNVDSQEEFDGKNYSKQSTDILEVIRMARLPPTFLGGRNMSYLRHTRREFLFDCKEPISFPNLELAGFALFEDKKGELFMLDRWSNFFEIEIGMVDSKNDEGSSTSNNSVEDVNRQASNNSVENHYYDAPSTMDDCTEMTIYCQSVKEKEYSRTSHDGSGLEVKYISLDGKTNVIIIFRLLPYGIRNRRVEVRGWRFKAPDDSWIPVSNAGIFDMKIGNSLSDDVSYY